MSNFDSRIQVAFFQSENSFVKWSSFTMSVKYFGICFSSYIVVSMNFSLLDQPPPCSCLQHVILLFLADSHLLDCKVAYKQRNYQKAWLQMLCTALPCLVLSQKLVHCDIQCYGWTFHCERGKWDTIRSRYSLHPLGVCVISTTQDKKLTVKPDVPFSCFFFICQSWAMLSVLIKEYFPILLFLFSLTYCRESCLLCHRFDVAYLLFCLSTSKLFFSPILSTLM